MLVLMNVLWAGTYAGTKDLMQHAPYFLVTSTRYLVAVVPLLLITYARGGLGITLGDFGRCVVIGVSTFTLCPLLMYTGVSMGRSSDAAILTSAEPLLVSLGAYLYLREKVGRRTAVALLIAFGGAITLSEFWRTGGAINPLSVFLIAGGVFFEAIFSVLGKELLYRNPPLKIVTYALLSGSLVNGIALSFLGFWPKLGALTSVDWFVLVVYLSLICTVGGYTWWYIALREDTTSKVAITIFIQPVVGILVSWAWVGERPTWSQGGDPLGRRARVDPAASRAG